MQIGALLVFFIALFQPISSQGSDGSRMLAVKEILKRDLIAFANAEYKARGSLATPIPREGFRLEIGVDFDSMMRNAPELDPKAPGFDEGTANFFHRQLAVGYITAAELFSEDFQRILKKALSPMSKKGFGGVKKTLGLLKNIVAKSKAEDFGKAFLIATVDSAYKFGVLMDDIREFQARAKRDDLPEMSEIIKKIQGYANRASALVYKPSLGLNYVAERKTIWKVLDQWASDVKETAERQF